MRIRHYRPADVPELLEIEERAAAADGRRIYDLAAWFDEHEDESLYNVLVITDDDDEVDPWGQSGTRVEVEGEIAGYTILQLREDERAYHFYCCGAVRPDLRRRGAGRGLLVSALNRARFWAADYEVEAEQEERALYFEAWLPERDPGSHGLATLLELEETDEMMDDGGSRLYRRSL
jgi:GNAT superfamily N-acetyltransferase